MLDGFDEITSSYKEAVIDLLHALTQTAVEQARRDVTMILKLLFKTQDELWAVVNTVMNIHVSKCVTNFSS
jgi:hypothetical protein